MAVAVRFHQFSEDLSEKVHDLNADTLRVYLSNTTPDQAADAVKADLAEIAGGNGYTTGGIDTLNATSRTNGVTSVTGTDAVWTASGGAIATFRYVVLYNDTPTAPADPLILYWDYGAAIAPAVGETFTTDFGTSMFTVG
jgi:hypothetical protein